MCLTGHCIKVVDMSDPLLCVVCLSWPLLRWQLELKTVLELNTVWINSYIMIWHLDN